MPLLVDTLNVLHVTGVLPPELAGPEPANLAAWIERSRYRRQKVSLVCDGQRPSRQVFSHGSFVTLIWTGSQTADDRIAALLESSSHPRQHIVVSSDHAVKKTAARRGAKVLSSAAFLEHLVSDLRRNPRAHTPNRNVKLDNESVAKWLETFGLSDIKNVKGKNDRDK